MSGWEYKTLVMNFAGGRYDAAHSDQTLNKAGQEGWELFAISPIDASGKTMALVHHFRRPLESQTTAGFKP